MTGKDKYIEINKEKGEKIAKEIKALTYKLVEAIKKWDQDSTLPANDKNIIAIETVPIFLYLTAESLAKEGYVRTLTEHMIERATDILNEEEK